MREAVRTRLGGFARRGVLGAILTVLLLAWALRDVSPSGVWAAMAGARPLWLLFAVSALLLSFAVRARRWQTLLGDFGRSAPFGALHSAVYVGFAANNLLPARAGEVLRAVALHRAGGVRLGPALGSVVAERVLDGFAVLFVLGALFWGADLGLAAGARGDRVVFAGVAVLGLAAAVAVALRWPDALASGVEGVVGRVASEERARAARRGVAGVLEGLAGLRSARTGVRAAAETLLMWGLISFTYWFSLLAFGLEGPGWTGGLWVMCATALAMAVPSAPGHFGTYEAGVRLALGVYGIHPDRMVAYAVGLHLLLYVVVTGVGLALAVRLGLLRRGPVVVPATPGAPRGTR
jgi:uncharacterized protein (TIRG00374 family)